MFNGVVETPSDCTWRLMYILVSPTFVCTYVVSVLFQTRIPLLVVANCDDVESTMS